jgi:glycosyltransferase involved in cell wall biosynthesis
MTDEMNSPAVLDHTPEQKLSPVLSFIIPVRNDPKRLQNCLASLLRDQCPAGSMEIIIGDNSTDGRCEDVAIAAGARLVKLPGINVASVRNGAADYARGEFLAFVDADHSIEPGWAMAAIDTFKHPGTGAAGFPYFPPETGTWVQCTYDRLRQRPLESKNVEWLGSGNLVIRRDLFKELGGFDSTLETCEDVDLCGRIRLAGYNLVANPAMRSVHWGDPATLKAVFRGELWRGRSNLRVSFRKPYSPRNVISALIPLANLSSVFLALFAALVAPSHRIVWVLLPFLVWLLSISLRAWRMRREDEGWSFSATLRNVAVAAVFEAARALALVLFSNHRRRSG